MNSQIVPVSNGSMMTVQDAQGNTYTLVPKESEASIQSLSPYPIVERLEEHKPAIQAVNPNGYKLTNILIISGLGLLGIILGVTTLTIAINSVKPPVVQPVVVNESCRAICF